ncbi:MAG: hypothetical protein NVSMB51_13650 [Solirubrobacteraceae bacterium]
MAEPWEPEEIRARRDARRQVDRRRDRRRLGLYAGVVLAVLVVAVLLAGGSGSPQHGKAAPARAARGQRTGTRTVTALAYTPGATLPAPLQDAAAALLGDGRLTLLGGLDRSGRSTPEVLVGGRRGGALPAKQHDASAALLGGAVYVFGGGDLASYDHILKWDPQTHRLSQAGRLPRRASDNAVVAVGDTAYIVGGYDGRQASADILAWKPGEAVARVVGHLPLALRYAAVAYAANRIVIAGGTSAAAATDGIFTFTPDSGRVTRLGRLPRPRTHAAAAALGNVVYLLGGRGQAASGSAVADVLSIDPASGRVHHAGRLPRPLSDAAALAGGNRILLAGGNDGRRSRAETGVLTLHSRTVADPARAAGTARSAALPGDLLIADRGNNRLLLVDVHHKVVWQFPNAADIKAHQRLRFNDDAFVAPGGRTIVANEEDSHVIVSIDIAAHRLTTLYGHFNHKGAGPGYLNTPDDAYPLADGSVVVADAYNCRVIYIRAKRIIRSIGRAGQCRHNPPHTFGAVNGDTPVAGGGLLVSEIPGAYVDALDAHGKLLYAFHPRGVSYPSDPQPLPGGRILLADYANPGGVVISDHHGRILWQYRPKRGNARLDHPSLALMLPNGNIAVNDDYRHRVVIIDPRRKRIIWQQGRTDHKGARLSLLNTPDGMDFVPADPAGRPQWGLVKHGS